MSPSECAQLKQDIARYQAFVNSLNQTLAHTSDPLTRKSLQSELATASKILEDTQTNYQRNCLQSPHPPPPFSLDAWQFSTPFGIDLRNGQWNSGSVNAVCPLPNDCLLIGAEQGGLWISEPDGQGGYKSRCLSDSWPHFQFNCFVADPANPNRVFAGCSQGIGTAGGVYVGNTAASFDDWAFLSLPGSLGTFVPGSGGSLGVGAMIILPLQRLLLVATGAGLGWTSIDILPFTWNVYSRKIGELANLPNDSFFFIADDATSPLDFRPTLNIGRISAGAVTANAVSTNSIHWVHRTSPANIQPLQIATCAGQPANAYCLGSVDDGPSAGLLFIVRSTDAGATWTECDYGTGEPQDLGAILEFPEHVPGPKSAASIAVHPANPQVVAAGYGGGGMSHNAGANWFDLTALPGWHDDIHDLYLDGPSDSLFIPSDGGLLRIKNAGASNPASADIDTTRNRTLPVVMLYAPGKLRTGRFGNLAVGPGLTTAAIIAAGSQDNEDLWCDPSLGRWIAAGGGDGGSVAIFTNAADTYLLYGQTSQAPVKWCKRQNGTMGSSAKIPIRLNRTTLDSAGLDPAYFRPVSLNVGLNVGPARSRVVALAAPAKSQTVFGAVFENAVQDNAGAIIFGQLFEWVALGQVPAGETISSLEAYDDASVLAGTASGRLFRIPISGSISEISFDQRPGAPIAGIASDGATIACFSQPALLGPGYLYVGRIAAPPLQRLSSTLFPPNTGSVFYAIGANRNTKFLRLSFALIAPENQIWVSNSPLGVVWHKWISGLPTTLHGSDLVITESATTGEIWLSTYGRGVWRLPFV